MSSAGNFGCLIEHEVRLVKFADFAERYLHDDPSTAIFKLRQFAELLCKSVAAHYALYIVHRIEVAFAWIDRLASEATSAHKLIDHLDKAVLAKAFRGELVPQDPNDEAASALLERIRAERAAPRKVMRGGRARAEA